MKKSKKKISSDNVGRMCKSGAVITANITAKRLTTPVGFLDYAPNNPDELKTNRRFKQYDNFGLLELKHTKFKNYENSKKIGGGGGGGGGGKNRSKSIFREIDKRYFENLLKLPKLVIIDDFTKKLTKQLYHNNNNNNKQNSIDFNCYKKQINDEIIKIDKLINRSIVIRESLIIRRMSSTQTTTTTTTSNSKTRKRQISDDNNDNNDNNDGGNNKENIPIKFPFIPSTNWVYQTPPNRKLNFNNFAKQQQQQQELLNDGCLIKPAVLHTNNDKTIVYEMNKFINVDLTNYQNRQEIDIDRRYMSEITNLQQFGEQHDQNESTVFRFNGNNGDNIEQLDIPTTDPYELEHHFLSLTCRPKKTISTVSRLQNIKRKRDMFSSTTTTTTTPLSPRKQTKFHENHPMLTNNNDREFESSFSLINQSNTDCIEESFTFKFTTTPTTSGRLSGNNYNNNIAGRLFDSKGNEKDSFTFQCDME